MQDLRLSPQAIEREVRSFVDFFVAWIRGDMDGGEEQLNLHWVPRCHPLMTVIMPSGVLLGMADMHAVMKENHGSNPDFAASVREIRVLSISQSQALVVYEEWQRNAITALRPNNGRISSALFCIDGSSRLRWRHLHQTWLPKEIVDVEPFEF